MSIDSAKKSRGRPKVDTEAVNVRMERGLVERLDSYRREQPDLPSRPEAVRRLVEKGLGQPHQFKRGDEIRTPQGQFAVLLDSANGRALVRIDDGSANETGEMGEFALSEIEPWASA